ncbi:MAG: membrane protease YdiL (CAAX protease family) [Phycisphaerales bacterium]|jgi:membrane protease YdiL (CAAX protease family)
MKRVMPIDQSHHEPTHRALGTRLPGPFDDEMPPQDPGTPNSRLFALLLAVVLATTVMIWQHLPQDTQFKALGLTPPPVQESPLVVAPLEPTSMYGRLIVKLKDTLVSDPSAMAEMRTELDKNASTIEDRVAIAIILGELEGPDAAIEQLQGLKVEVQLGIAFLPEPPADEPTDETVDETNDATANETGDQPGLSDNAELLRDIDDLNTVYLNGSETLDEPAATRLRERYGYIGRVALTHDLTDADPEFAKLRGGGLAVLLGLIAFGALLVFGFLAGSVLLILGLIRYLPHWHRARFEPPAPGGSVMLETYALFVGSFFAVAITGTVVTALKPELAIWTLPLQFSIMALVLWPLLRGMPVKAWREAVGLVAPRGLLREIGFGFLAYLAAVPLFIAGTIITLILVLLQQLLSSGGDPEPPANDIIDLIGGADWVTIALFALLATVWAPITEELIFRGALYRHLRAHLHWVLAALFSSMLFAGMHNYPVVMLTPLIVLGFMFAMMREIRGSIIASITAHFIHNATLVLVMVFVLRPLIA